MKFYGLSMMLFLMALNMQSAAQTCNGVLGDTVFNINFGSGAGRGAPLPLNESDYSYTASNQMSNRQYSILNNTGGFYSQWFTTTDHTGNKNGYLMVLNCDKAGDLLYKKQISGLCPNTTYEYASWILNMVNADLLKGIPVDLTFSVETTAGVLLNSYRTGAVQESKTVDWKRFNFYFTTPVGTMPTDVVLKIVNNAPGGDGNDVGLDDMTLRPCVPVVQASFDQANSPSALTLCEGNDAGYHLSANVTSGYNNPTYQWQVNANDGLGWTDLSGENSTQVTVVFKSAKVGTYQYRLYNAQAENKNLSCCQIFSNTVTVQVNPKPVPAASSNSPVCEEGTLDLSVANGASYQWTGPGGFTSSQQKPFVSKMTQAQTGIYRVTLTSADGCTATDSVDVVLNPTTKHSAGADVTICQGSSTVLNASGGNLYRWQPALGLSDAAIADPVASPAVTTDYTVYITNLYGCVYTDLVTVNVAKKPVADAGPDKKTVTGKSVRLSGKIQGDHYTYYWSPATYLTDANTLAPLATPTQDITYALHVVSQYGCSESVDSVTVQVSQEFVVPNTFSPNGDGINDTWNIPALDAYPGSTIEVYNRYGKEIFRSIGNSKPWDGTINGQPLPIGTYYYKISTGNEANLKAGWVFLVR